MALKPDQTVCFKIDQALAQVQVAAKTGYIDAGSMAHLLHAIRESAQTMESAIKLRKEVMATVPGLEETYKAKKFKRETPTPGGTNLIADVTDRSQTITGTENPKYEVTIKENDTVIYHNKGAVAGIFCAVEEITDVDEHGSLEGITQKFDFGHPIAAWFAMDQFNIYFEGHRIEIAEAMHAFLNPRLLMDPQMRALIKNALQLNKKKLV